MNNKSKNNDYGSLPSRENEKLPNIHQRDRQNYQNDSNADYDSQGNYGNGVRNNQGNTGYAKEPLMDKNEFDNAYNGVAYTADPNFSNENKTFVITHLNSNSYNFDCNGGRPLQLISVNSGNFELNMDAIDELSQFEGNVAFVSIVGKYRTGKSLLFNKILGLKESGFRVDPSTDGCTQGIWIWSKPIYLQKDNLNIFFLDCEGSNSLEKSAQHDAKIFTLTMLMSSFMIYNSIGVLDENTINELSLLTKLTKNIIISQKENPEYALSYYTPKFLWLLRDFNLDLVDNRGKPITTNQYLESALIDQSGTTKTSETNKKIRQALLDHFKDRYCHIMIKPVDDLTLKRATKIPDSQINPEFLKQLKTLKEMLISQIMPKQLRGVNLTAKMYFAAVIKFVETMNNDGIPNISSAWDFIVENECRDAYDFSINLYEYALKQFFFNTVTEAKVIDEIYHILKNIRDKTMEKYNTLTAYIEKSPEVQNTKEKLKEYLDQREDAAIMMNEELAQVNNEGLLKTLSQTIKANLSKGLYSEKNIELYCNDFNEMAIKYDNGAKGLKTCNPFIAFLNSLNKECIQSMASVIKKNYQLYETEFTTEKNKIAAIQQDLQNKLKEYQQREEMYERQIADAKKEKEKAIDKNKQLEKDKDNALARCRDYEVEIDKYKREDYKKKYEDKTQEYTKNEKLLEEEKRKHQADIEDLNTKLSKKKACCNIF